MKRFSDFGIVNSDPFRAHRKIDIEEVFDKEIEVTAYEIAESKYFEEDSKRSKNAYPYCLKLGFKMDGKELLTFTGSKNLVETIKQIPQSELPFTTTIKKGKDRTYYFT